MYGFIFFIRAFIAEIIGYFLSALMTIFGFFFLFFPGKIFFFWMILFTDAIRFVLRILCSIKIEVRGLENIDKNKQYLIVSEHQSIMETMFVFNKYFPKMRYVLKQELQNIPLWSFLINAHIGLPIDRSGSKRSLQFILEAAKKFFKDGYSLVIFPTGTRVIPGKNVKWKSGYKKIYAANNIPILPVALNSGAMWSKKRLKAPGTIIIEFLPEVAAGLSVAELDKLVEEKVKIRSKELVLEGASELALQYWHRRLLPSKSKNR